MTSSISARSSRNCAPKRWWPPLTGSPDNAVSHPNRIQDNDVPAVSPLRLGVNIDHVATIRNARGGRHPDPVRAATLAIQAGADGITAHLREDRRHISDDDIERLKASIPKPLNLEMAATPEMVEIAVRTKPHAACLVPERRAER